MGSVGIYIRSVCAAGIFCAILSRLLPGKSSWSGIYKMISGMVMVFVIAAPLRNLDISELPDGLFGMAGSSAEYVQIGEEYSRKAVSEIIKNRTEAYILDKAASWSGDIEVDIELSGDALPVPVSVRISGTMSPYGKSALSSILTHELGIAKEQQIWICTS